MVFRQTYDDTSLVVPEIVPAKPSAHTHDDDSFLPVSEMVMWQPQTNDNNSVHEIDNMVSKSWILLYAGR